MLVAVVLAPKQKRSFQGTLVLRVKMLPNEDSCSNFLRVIK